MNIGDIVRIRKNDKRPDTVGKLATVEDFIPASGISSIKLTLCESIDGVDDTFWLYMNAIIPISRVVNGYFIRLKKEK